MDPAKSFNFSADYDIHLKIAIKAPISLIKFSKTHLSYDLECLIEEDVYCPELSYKAAGMSPALFCAENSTYTDSKSKS